MSPKTVMFTEVYSIEIKIRKRENQLEYVGVEYGLEDSTGRKYPTRTINFDPLELSASELAIVNSLVTGVENKVKTLEGI